MKETWQPQRHKVCVALLLASQSNIFLSPSTSQTINQVIRRDQISIMSLLEFAQSRVPQILATAALVGYALKRNKLTNGGIFAGIFVAVVHMISPWPAFFWLLILFFLFGTVVTKVSNFADL